MKLRYKISIIFILFFFFIILNNTNSFAITYGSNKYISVYTGDYSLSDLSDFAYSETGVDSSIYPYVFIAKNMSSSIFTMYLLQEPLYVKLSNTTLYLYSSSENFVEVTISTNGINRSMYKINTLETDEITMSDYFGYVVNYSTVEILTNKDVYYLSNSSIFLEGTKPEPDKINLFELNLTDKNFNDTQHKFYLKSDSNSAGYNELMTYINTGNNYTIYLTDYVRYLTFENTSIDCPITDGHYKISGYIDFLISEQAYFYFSPHYNRIKICSGDYRGEDLTTYTKRFFFTLVASEDSSNLYFDIYSDNGCLWNLSDYVNDGNTSISDTIEDISNSYFIGSNQTIYYAKEDNNYILESLTDSIYYIGCNGPGKIRGEDSRIYNFGFSGGHTKQFFLSDGSFDSDVENSNNEISSKRDEDIPIVYDTSNGTSAVVPEDTTSYTYIYYSVTDDTSAEDDANNIETDRGPYISDNTIDDTTGWSIWDFLKGIFSTLANLVADLISAITSLLVPTDDFFSTLFNDLNDWFSLKLGFIFYPFDLFIDIFDRIMVIEFTEPVINIPDMKEPVTGHILIHATIFNFNDLLIYDSFKIIHNIYLTIVDAIIIFNLVNLLRRKFEEVTGK